MFVLKKQVAEIHREANVFIGKRRPDILIDGELSAEADGVVVENSECRRAEKNLMRLRVWYSDVRLQESVGAFSD